MNISYGCFRSMQMFQKYPEVSEVSGRFRASGFTRLVVVTRRVSEACSCFRSIQMIHKYPDVSGHCGLLDWYWSLDLYGLAWNYKHVARVFQKYADVSEVSGCFRSTRVFQSIGVY